jgi:hypothetical protein
MRRHGANNADYRGGVTCLYDTQLPGARLYAFECGGRFCTQAARSMPDVPIALSSHRVPGRVRGCRLGQPGVYEQGGMGAFAARFGSITPVLGVGTSQYRGY